MQHVRIYSNSVVAHQDPEMSARIFYFYFDAVRTCMHKSVHQGLAANPVDFIADDWPHRTFDTIDNHAEVSFIVEGEFLSQSRESRLQALIIRFRCAQPADCISALFRDRTHLLQYSF